MLTGKLLKVNVKEGQIVHTGDILYTIEHNQLLLEKSKINKKLKEEEQKLNNLKKYKQSIIKNENLFLKENINSEYYSNKYEHYKANLDYLKYQLNANELQLTQSNTTKIINTQIKVLKNKLQLLLTLKKSIENNTNYLKDSVYHSKFEEYISNIVKLKNDYNRAKKIHTDSIELEKNGIISKNELYNKKVILTEAKLALEKYKITYNANLQTEINNTEKTLKQKQIEYENAVLVESRLNNEKNYKNAAIKKHKLDTLVGINDEIKSSEDTIKMLKNNIDNINLKIKNTIIAAPIEGRVNIIFEVAKEDYIVAGTKLMTIIPLKESKYKVQIMLPNKDVASIKRGDKIKFHFYALPYKEFGEFKGIVTNISSDIKTNSKKAGYYLLEAALKTKEGINYKGEKRYIKVGMTCEAYIITNRKKILYWLLQKLNLRD